jgi:glutamine amidotransferase
MKRVVGIVGYRMGNIASLLNAFSAIGVEAFVADAPAQLSEATHLVLPGVGAFPTGMEHLRALGFEPILRRLVLEEGRPLLGVCLGMQLLASVGEEHRVCEGLGLIPGRVTRLDAKGLRLPHIGWNDTVSVRDNALLGPAGATECFYYVHSFHLVPDDPQDAILTCDYGQTFIASVARRTIFGVQFHPEKSHAAGLAVLKRFTQQGALGAQASADPVPVPAERAHRA